MTVEERLVQEIGYEGILALYPNPDFFSRDLRDLRPRDRRNLYTAARDDDHLWNRYGAAIIKLTCEKLKGDKHGTLYKASWLHDDQRVNGSWGNDGTRPGAFIIVRSDQGEHALRVPWRFAYYNSIRGYAPIKEIVAWTFNRPPERYQPKIET